METGGSCCDVFLLYPTGDGRFFFLFFSLTTAAGGFSSDAPFSCNYRDVVLELLTKYGGNDSDFARISIYCLKRLQVIQSYPSMVPILQSSGHCEFLILSVHVLRISSRRLVLKGYSSTHNGNRTLHCRVLRRRIQSGL